MTRIAGTLACRFDRGKNALKDEQPVGGANSVRSRKATGAPKTGRQPMAVAQVNAEQARLNMISEGSPIHRAASSKGTVPA